MIKIYGIPNCDTIKKARKWLESNGVEYEFHDYKKAGVPVKELKTWVRRVGWETLLNRRGTTWRKLDASVRDSVNADSAVRIMRENPSIIKRPVLVGDRDLILIGFSEDEYSAQLK